MRLQEYQSSTGLGAIARFQDVDEAGGDVSAELRGEGELGRVNGCVLGLAWARVAARWRSKAGPSIAHRRDWSVVPRRLRHVLPWMVGHEV